ncbi:MAG TPA: YfhO family protein, partial [Bacteroidota bacterium]|nr:YfhO family protein [Bacteroidota bacterium]
FSKFRDPARMAILFSLAASVLAGTSLQAILSGELNAAESRRLRLCILGAGGAGVLLWFGVTTGILTQALGMPVAPAIQDAVRTDAHWSLLFVVASGGALAAILARKLSERTALYALPLLLLADMYVFGAAQNTSATDPDDYFRRAAPIVRFLRNDMRTGLFRVNTRNQYGMLMDRNQGMVDRVFTLEGYTPLTLQRANPPFTDTQRFDLLNVKYKTALDTRTNGLTIVPHASFMPRAFILYRTRVAASEAELVAAIHDTLWDHRTTVLLEERPPVTPVLPPEGGAPVVQIAAYGDNRIEIDAATPTDGILVLSEMYYPGWRATVDGVPEKILRADYTLRALALRSGSHRVVFDFTPQPFVAGAWISGGTVTACLAGLALLSLRRVRSREKGR